jgi:TrmH family RNA methyltransferase
MLTKADIARLRSLREKKHREALGLFVVEGEKVVAELIAENFPLKEIHATPAFISEIANLKPQIPITPVTPGEMARISHFPTPGAVLAVGQITRPTLAPGELTRGLTLVLDDVQDPGNVGTLLRIADWYAFDRVLCSPGCADLFSQKVIDASMGSFRRVRAITMPLAPALAGAAKTGTPILGCDLDGAGIHTLPPLRDAIVVIGSEGRGLSPGVRATITRFVTIPRYGRAESLNAANAAAIIADNIRRLQT